MMDPVKLKGSSLNGLHKQGAEAVFVELRELDGLKKDIVSEKMDKIIDAIQKKIALEKAFCTIRSQERLNRIHMMIERLIHTIANIENSLNFINEHKDVLAEFIETKTPMSSLNMPYSQQRNFIAEMESFVKICNEADQTLRVSNIYSENINSQCESTQKTDCQEEISEENYP